MSVVSKSKPFKAAYLPLTEAASLSAISGLVTTARDLNSGLRAMAETALRVPGLHKVQITPSIPLPALEAFEWYASTSPALCGSAMALVEANGRSWGRLRLHFEPQLQTLESPLRFARFLAQQAAILLNRFELENRYGAYLNKMEALKKRLNTRIAVHRAAGILAELRGGTNREALELLIQQARSSRRTLLSLADAIILGHTAFRSPFFRPLQRNEPYGRARLFV